MNTKYVNDMEERRARASKEISACLHGILKNKNEIRDLNYNTELSFAGKDKRKAALNADIEMLQEKMNTVIAKYIDDVGIANAGIKEKYGASYMPMPEHYDRGARRVLASGILTPAEMTRYFEKYKDNPVMLRLIKKALPENATDDISIKLRLNVIDKLSEPSPIEEIESFYFGNFNYVLNLVNRKRIGQEAEKVAVFDQLTADMMNPRAAEIVEKYGSVLY